MTNGHAKTLLQPPKVTRKTYNDDARPMISISNAIQFLSGVSTKTETEK